MFLLALNETFLFFDWPRFRWCAVLCLYLIIVLKSRVQWYFYIIYFYTPNCSISVFKISNKEEK